MTKYYSFTCYDTEDKTETKVEFNTENPSWIGYDAPMHKFFTFLKGCGFIFGVNDEIGVMTKKDVFRNATE